MKNFWEKLNRPFFVLAPMLDVTDTAFRQIIAKYGKPDVFWTEFVAVDGLCSDKGREKLKQNLLQFNKSERPIVAQLFGSKPRNFEKSAKIIATLGFDGIDINMGCPQKNILKQGAGAELIKHPELAKEIIKATKRGAGGLPVSVKTRIGYNKNEIETWISIILEEEPAILIIHGRTKKEMSKVSAHWDLIKEVREIRDKMKSKTLIIGNGDVLNLRDAEEKAKETGVDGIMVGRGIFGNPWLFNESVQVVAKKDKLKVALEHTKLFEKTFGENKKNLKLFKGKGRAKNFALMKKHYKAYINGFEGAKELRIKLMEAENSKEAEKIIDFELKKK